MQRLSEQTSKGDLVHRALKIERLISKLDYNFLRTEIPNHVQEGPGGHQHFKDNFYYLYAAIRKILFLITNVTYIDLYVTIFIKNTCNNAWHTFCENYSPLTLKVKPFTTEF